MSLLIYYTPYAKETLRQTYEFIKNKFGIRAADKLELKAEKTISLIAEFPYMFKASTIDESIRIGLISKQT
jgi:plasmid stabilization system protein ParE